MMNASSSKNNNYNVLTDTGYENSFVTIFTKLILSLKMQLCF